jgi:hypothetical protein
MIRSAAIWLATFLGLAAVFCLSIWLIIIAAIVIQNGNIMLL